MRYSRPLSFCILIILMAGCSGYPAGSSRAVDSITVDELRLHLAFLASDEFAGRDTPSPELKIASRYLANMVESYGLQSLMPDGSWYQPIALDVIDVDPVATRLIVRAGSRRFDFGPGTDFGIPSRITEDSAVTGTLFFAGLGVSAPQLEWDDIGTTDLTGKIVVILDPVIPDGHPLATPEGSRAIRNRTNTLLRAGATAVLVVIGEEREREFEEQGLRFASSRYVYPAEDLKSPYSARRQYRFSRAELRHATAASVLGISDIDLDALFAQVGEGRQVPSRTIQGRSVEIAIRVSRRVEESYNVVAMVEGSDSRLKDEYIVLSSHHDHLGMRNGLVLNGADDDGSGTVAMLEIAQALMLKRPKRSTILVWHTGEERGLVGSQYFVQNCPVPVEKISAELNMDMLCRNATDSLYVIGSNKLSSELDEAINRVNDRTVDFALDYRYEDPAHPDRFFFRSDHYPFIQYGIPGVWYFCGTTSDYHQPTDTVDRVDFDKMLRATRLVYLTALEIGNMPRMLALDLHPGITSRGEQNLSINWRETNR
ncbi:M28 family peptidase [Gemmatimonadota bacterium]